MANLLPVQTSIADGVSDAHSITPFAMRLFCADNPGECRGGGGSEVSMSAELIAVLGRVNDRVNRSIRPQAEPRDVWRLNPTSGDCEDYALTKRSALIRNGVPAGALRLAYTRTRTGTSHVVLIVRTSEGDYVLDNLRGSIRSLSASGYVIRSMSSANPMQWVAH